MIAGWIGWLAAGLAIAAFTAVFIAQRRRKAAQVPSHWRIPIDGFADVSVVREVSETRARMIAYTLETTRDAVLEKCSTIYKYEPKHPWSVDKIGVVTDPSVMPKNVADTNWAFWLSVEKPLCTVEPSTVVPT